MSNWKKYKLDDFAEINPSESITKGTFAKRIPMEAIQPFTKRIPSFSFEEYNGGVKFKNGDTIMARITPSLENGKTSYVDILDDGEIGFGSTEFIVFREKQDVSDKHFVYYLATSPIVRNTAIKSMTGSSGRQRVQTDVVKEHLFDAPELPEQKAIAEVLSSLDDKIDLLHRQNKTLEQMAETLYESWVSEIEFESTIKDIIDIQNGFAFKSKSFQENGNHRVLKIKNISGGIVDIQATDFVSDSIISGIDKRFIISTGDVLFAMTGAKIGKMGIIPQTKKSLWLNQRVGLFKEKFKGARFFAYLHLKSDFGIDYIENTATGSAQPNISGTGIENCEFPRFSKKQLLEYSEQLDLLFSKVIFNLGQVRTLEKMRDTLLPKLMSGEVTVNLD